MLHSFKRWIGRERPEGADWSDVIAWAAERGLAFRRERDDRGFVVEGSMGAQAWRMEWGPPQRAYLTGPELRLRCDAGLPPELQMLLVSAALAESLERDAFSRFTEQAQTEVDLALPEEMRWLALFRRVPMGRWRELRGRLDAVAAMPSTVESWLDDAGLVEQLDIALGSDADGPAETEGAAPGAAASQPHLRPLVLMTLRGRLYLRTELPQPRLATLDLARRVFEVALQALVAPASQVRSRAAVRRPVSADLGLEELPDDDADDGISTAWQTRAGVEPGDEAIDAATSKRDAISAGQIAVDPGPAGR